MNDNLMAQNLQGHSGVIAECSACHGASTPGTNGPHGLHPLGQSWISQHHDVAEKTGTGPCQDCHGVDYRGTELSRTKAARSFTTERGKKSYTLGQMVTCYDCHNGPRGS